MKVKYFRGISNKNDIFHSWDQLDGSPHIEYARWADDIGIYPATANL